MKKETYKRAEFLYKEINDTKEIIKIINDGKWINATRITTKYPDTNQYEEKELLYLTIIQEDAREIMLREYEKRLKELESEFEKL